MSKSVFVCKCHGKAAKHTNADKRPKERNTLGTWTCPVDGRKASVRRERIGSEGA